MIQLQDVTLQRGSKILIQDSDAIIYDGQKVGIVGPNGAGKSSLFMLFLNELGADTGTCLMPTNMTIAHIRQDMPAGENSAVDYTLQGDAEYWQLQLDLTKAEIDNDGMAISNIHLRLAEIDGYSMPSKACKILLGLGFTQEELNQPVQSFSGGWRMRLNLAQVLISRAELLLLDEPTNHLDLEAIFWLEEWLKKTQQTVLLISHDREFLDHVIGHTIHVFNQTLTSYTGNYSSFEKQRAEQLAIQQSTYVKQQQTRAHLQSFVDRFRSKASKAKQAQSRIKMLEKMQFVSAVNDPTAMRFEFKPCKDAGTPMLQCRDIQLGYDDHVVLERINCAIRDGDRIGLIGPNGAGKSTLIKLFANTLNAQSGDTVKSDRIKIGYFAQHQLEQLEMDKTPLQYMLTQNKGLTEGEARKYLGSFNFRNDDVFRPVHQFSGGEKARMVLALIIWQAPNLLLLDEPSNHLDLDMREALSLALQDYQGAMVIVSHDRYLLESVSDELWLVADHKVEPFDGSIDDYQAWTKVRLQEISQAQSASKKTKNKSTNSNNLKDTKPKDQAKIDKQIEKLESQLGSAQQKLAAIDEQLSDPDVYNTTNQNKLNTLNQEREDIIGNINTIENKILTLIENQE